MDGKKEDGYLLGVSPRSTTPPRATLAQLAEERLGSLQYLLQSKNGVTTTSSPPTRHRPRASTATAAGGTGRAAGRGRRSTSGNVEEAASEASGSVARSRGLFSSAPNVASRERPRSQGSASSSRSRQAGKSSSSSGSSTYRLSIDNNLERAPMGSNQVDGRSPSASAWRHRPQPTPSSSTGSTPERSVAEVAGLAAPRQARGRWGSSTGLSTTASAGGTPARKLSGSSIYGGSDHSRGSYGGVGILGKGGGDDSDSFFGYSDDDEYEEGAEVDDAEDFYHRRRRLQNSCCILVGVSWMAALLLYVCGGSATSAAATAFGAAAACALLGVVALATLAHCWGLPSWRSREEGGDDDGDGDRETCSCCLWGRRREVDEGGKLAEIGGVTYLAI
eukprot:g7057.t1